MKLRFTARAVQDISEIADYIRRDNPRAALRVRDTILETIALLSSFPKLGKLQSVENVRKLATRRFPNVIYYQIDEVAGEAVVLTIQHSARDTGT